MGTHFLLYLYDENGAPVGLQYRNKTYGTYTFDTYYFEKNLQGDIIAIYTENGTKIGSYTYDAWGNCTVSIESGTTTIQKQIVRTLNPFRYRGYYYDTDTGLYYLQSRYYNPKWGRFLNADGYVSTGTGLLGYNMYAYCGNNPVMGYDPTGEIAIVDDLLFWGGVALVALVIVVASPIIIDTLEYITEGVYQLASEVIDVIDAIDYVTPPHSITNNDEATIDPPLVTEKRAGPKGKPGRKKQGREVNEKKRGKNFKSRSNKDPNRPMKKHTPGRDHRHAKTMIPYINNDMDNNEFTIQWSE